MNEQRVIVAIMVLCMTMYGLFKNGNWYSIWFIEKLKSGPAYVLLSAYGLIFFDFLVLRMY